MSNKQNDIWIENIDEVIVSLKALSADLKVQAMMFDMDIDWETLELTAKNDYKEAVWLTRWKEKVADGDAGAESPEQAWA